MKAALAALMMYCPGTTFHEDKNFVEADVGRPHIYVNFGELSSLPRRLWPFVILHECGHTKGIDSEVGADAYALARMKITKQDAAIMCKNISTPSRCKQMKRKAQ